MGKRFSCFIIIVFVLINISASAQISIKSSAGITASLINGISLSSSAESFKFNSADNWSSSYPHSIDPQFGIMLNVTGKADQEVLITFNEAKLSNTELFAVNGEPNTSLLFTPSVQHTSCSSTYSTPKQISSGSSLNLRKDKTGFGRLYFWIGGSLNANELQHNYKYDGTFSINITY